MIILGIESSCDETSASVCEFTEDGIRRILSNIVATQIETHALYGGVVPEIASRAHAEAITPVVERAVSEAGISLSDIGAIAVTCAPGLIGSLLVGVSYAKALSFSLGIPLIPVNHMKAHVAASYLRYPELKPPFKAIVVSGSHTSIYNVTDYTTFEEIGSSRDDAAGEAFDKVGRVIGLKYPCGKDMDKLCSEADNDMRIKLPSPALRDGSLDFSFSGLKTAVINYVHNLRQLRKLGDNDELPRDEILKVASSFTYAVCDAVVEKLGMALDKDYSDKIVLAGGASANSHLQKSIRRMCDKRGISLYVPELSLCGDNGAMVASQGYYDYIKGIRADEKLNAYASEEGAYSDGVFDNIKG